MPDLVLSLTDAIDLHLHTLYSDGHWQPVALFDYLASVGFRAVAVADHDTLDHVEEMRALGVARGIHVIAGVEVTTSWRGLGAHLLCYACYFEGDGLVQLVRGTVQAQLDNTHAVYAELLRRGYTFPRQAEVLAERQGAVVRPIDNATLLYTHGYAASMDEALRMIADAGYRQITVSLDMAVAAAHAAGGVVLLAHPGRGGGEIQRYDPPLLRELLAQVPLDGIEAYYPAHAPAQTAAYLALARERGLLVSAGSDSHGSRQRLPVQYPARNCAALLARCGVMVG